MSVQAPRTIAAAVLTVATIARTAFAQNAATADANRTAAPAAPAPAALKQLDPADLAFWKNIRYTALSNDGQWFAYQLTPNEGDAEVVVGHGDRVAVADPRVRGQGLLVGLDRRIQLAGLGVDDA